MSSPTPISLATRLRNGLVLLVAAFVGLSAAGTASAQFDPAAPEPLQAPTGTILVVGAGPVSYGTRAHFVEAAGGSDARIVVIPAAQATADSPDDDPRARWTSFALAGLELLQPASRSEAGAAMALARLPEATGVWIDDGDPARIVELFGGTHIEAELRRILDRGGVVGAHNRAARCLTAAMLTDRGDLVRGFDLLPGSILDTWPDDTVRNRRLRDAVSIQSARVGFGVPADTNLWFEGRRIRAEGKRPAEALVAASDTRPWRIDRIDRGRRADLIALSRAAAARLAEPFPLPNPPEPNLENGTLILAGGGDPPRGLLQRFLELAGGHDAPIVFIPCSPAEAIAREPSMVRTLRAIGATDVTWIHTKDRRRADSDEAILGPLRRARGIWFGGGRQWNLVDSYENTTAHRLMHEVLARGGVIGGSSAGASIQADFMVRGDPLGNLTIAAEGYERGFGFLTGVAIDQHFSNRGRQKDMVLLMNSYPQLLGIGLDEGTALVVSGSTAEVVALPGKRHVYFYDHTQDSEAPHRIGAGERFDLRARAPIPPPDH